MNLYYFLLLFPVLSFGQNLTDNDSISAEKPNPIIFADFYGGWGGFDGADLKKGHRISISGGFSLNYQFNKSDLITARINSAFSGKNIVDIMIPIDIFSKMVVTEYGALYGKRYFFDETSISFSGGIALYDRQYYEKVNNKHIERRNNAIGFPFEISIKRL